MHISLPWRARLFDLLAVGSALAVAIMGFQLQLSWGLCALTFGLWAAGLTLTGSYRLGETDRFYNVIGKLLVDYTLYNRFLAIVDEVKQLADVLNSDQGTLGNFATINLANLGPGLFLTEALNATGIAITVQAATPEPGTFLLIGSGLPGLLYWRRRRRV